MVIDYAEIDRRAELRRADLRTAADWLAVLPDWAANLSQSLGYFSSLKEAVDRLDPEGRALLGVGTYGRITEVAAACEQFKTRVTYDGSKGNVGNLSALSAHIRSLK